MKNLSFIITVLALFGLTGCEKIKSLVGGAGKGTSKTEAITAVESPKIVEVEASKVAKKDALASVNGIEISDDEVTERVKNRLSKLEAQIFDIKMDGLTSIIEEKILEGESKKKNLSIDELLKAEVESQVAEPGEEEIQNYYNVVKKRFGDKPLEQVRSQLVGQLRQTKTNVAYNNYISGLRKNAQVKINMERPRTEVSVDDDPMQGEKGDALITLIEFSDFQCPFCKRTRPTIQSILDQYKGKVKYVFRDFPLSFHQQAPKAHQAANCAGEQDKYWEYSDIIWENQQAIGLGQLKTYATDLKLDADKFNECLDSNKYQAEIDKDIREGSLAGVSGTPAYFVNGIFISGAQPLERFQEVIEEELIRLEK